MAASCVTVAGFAPAAEAAASKSCSPVVNPYPATRFDGVDLSHIKALRVSCATARRTARGAHRRSLRLGGGGVRRFTWNGWKVTGDLRPISDIYVASNGTLRVRWRF